MTSVGIIAILGLGKTSPVGCARLRTRHQEKVYIVRRAILGLNGAGVDEVVFLPISRHRRQALSGVTRTSPHPSPDSGDASI